MQFDSLVVSIVCLLPVLLFVFVLLFKALLSGRSEIRRTVQSKDWRKQVRKDYDDAYTARFGTGTPYSMTAQDEREKADRSTAYWQRKYRESKK